MRSRPFTVDRRAVAGTREWPGPHPAVIIARLILLVLVGTLSVYATQQPSRVIWTVLLAIAAVPAGLGPPHPGLRAPAPVAPGVLLPPPGRPGGVPGGPRRQPFPGGGGA